MSDDLSGDDRVDDDDHDGGGNPVGFDLLTVAARELIGAARLMLDAVEQVVDDPAAATGAGAAVGDIVRQAARVGASFLAPRPPPPTPRDHDDDDEGGGGVQFIKVD